jgi:hypothetical protein
MNATEAYKMAIEANTGTMNEILDEIKDACSDGIFECEFYEEDYSNIDSLMNELRNMGYDVKYVEDDEYYVVSWAHAKN